MNSRAILRREAVLICVMFGIMYFSLEYFSVEKLKVQNIDAPNEQLIDWGEQGELLKDYNLEVIVPEQAKKLAFLIRTPTTAPGKLDRFKRWMNELFEEFGEENIDIWMMVDVSRSNQTVIEIQQELNPADGWNYQVFAYTIDQMLEQFPYVEGVPLRKSENYAWLIPTLHLQLWWKHVQGAYSHVWAIEDDTDRCGNIAELIRFYEEDPLYAEADVISDILVQRFQNWSHFNQSNQQFNGLIGLDERYFSREHFQRYSFRFLTHVWTSGLKGIHAHGEMFTPSFCHKLASIKQCTWANMKKHHIGDRFGWQDRLNETEFEETCASTGQGKLFHAMKW